MAAPPESKTVLVVDDDRDTRDVVTDVLEAEGYQVVTAIDGREAIDFLRTGRTPPSLILLDLTMPRMDGAQFRAEQQRDPTLDAIPVVMLSADAALSSMARLLRVAAHLKKPVPLEALLDTVRAHCR